MLEYSAEKTLQFEYKESILKGSFVYSEKDMVCRLEIPDGYLSGGSHIPYFGPDVWTEEKAEERAKQKLMELWDYYNSVLEHKEEILQALPDYFEQKAQAKREYDETHKKICDLKKSLREGTVSNKDYQKALSPLRRKRENAEFSSGWYFDHLLSHILKEQRFYKEREILTILGINEKQ